MESNPLLHLIQTTALKELPIFTRDQTQKVTQFIDSVERIGTFTELNDSLLYSIATIKLGGAAFNWYDNNKDTLQSWQDLKHHLLERFRPSLSTANTQLKECKQQPGESLIIYYDDVIDLCKQVDKNMTLHMIVDYLQDGLRPELKIHVKRQLKTLNDSLTPAIFLKLLVMRRSYKMNSLLNNKQLLFLHSLIFLGVSPPLVTRRIYSTHHLIHYNLDIIQLLVTLFSLEDYEIVILHHLYNALNILHALYVIVQIIGLSVATTKNRMDVINVVIPTTMYAIVHRFSNNWDS